jgi:hypothetical protein
VDWCNTTENQKQSALNIELVRVQALSQCPSRALNMAISRVYTPLVWKITKNTVSRDRLIELQLGDILAGQCSSQLALLHCPKHAHRDWSWILPLDALVSVGGYNEWLQDYHDPDLLKRVVKTCDLRPRPLLLLCDSPSTALASPSQLLKAEFECLLAKKYPWTAQSPRTRFFSVASDLLVPESEPTLSSSQRNHLVRQALVALIQKHLGVQLAVESAQLLWHVFHRLNKPQLVVRLRGCLAVRIAGLFWAHVFESLYHRLLWIDWVTEPGVPEFAQLFAKHQWLSYHQHSTDSEIVLRGPHTVLGKMLSVALKSSCHVVLELSSWPRPRHRLDRLQPSEKLAASLQAFVAQHDLTHCNGHVLVESGTITWNSRDFVACDQLESYRNLLLQSPSTAIVFRADGTNHALDAQWPTLWTAQMFLLRNCRIVVPPVQLPLALTVFI